MSKHRAFKGTERAIAKHLGGTRRGHLGGVDVTTDWLAVECKHRQTLPTWLTAAMQQAQRHAAMSQLPIVVLHEHGGKHADNLVVMRLGDFREWFGDVGMSVDTASTETSADKQMAATLNMDLEGELGQDQEHCAGYE